MSPDLCLILHTAQAYSDIFSTKSIGNTLSKTCLPGPRWSCEEEDGALLVMLEFHNCKVLNNTVFDLFESVMVPLQYAPGFSDVNTRGFCCYPGKIEQEIQVISDNRTLMPLISAGLKFFHFC